MFSIYTSSTWAVRLTTTDRFMRRPRETNGEFTRWPCGGALNHGGNMAIGRWRMRRRDPMTQTSFFITQTWKRTTNHVPTNFPPGMTRNWLVTTKQPLLKSIVDRLLSLDDENSFQFTTKQWQWVVCQYMKTESIDWTNKKLAFVFKRFFPTCQKIVFKLYLSDNF